MPNERIKQTTDPAPMTCQWDAETSGRVTGNSRRMYVRMVLVT